MLHDILFSHKPDPSSVLFYFFLKPFPFQKDYPERIDLESALIITISSSSFNIGDGGKDDQDIIAAQPRSNQIP